MALIIPPCCRCNAKALQMTLKEGEGWICSSHLPPEIEYHIYPDPAESGYVITGVVRGLRKCEGCGEEWGSRGVSRLSIEELEKNDMRSVYMTGLLHSNHPLVEIHKQKVREQALFHHNKPMPSCQKCEKVTT